jgi:hypothetical protein
MKRCNRVLTTEETSALNDCAAEHGRYWKHALREDWHYAGRPGILQALRNDPTFDLDQFKATK